MRLKLCDNCSAFSKALDYAIRIIESYEMEIRNSRNLDFIGIDLKKKGFCQGKVYKDAVQDIEDILDENLRDLSIKKLK